MEHIVELGGIVTGFNVTEHCIDCMCGKNLVKIDKYSRDVICQKTIFEKEGLSRKLIADDEQIFVYRCRNLICRKPRWKTFQNQYEKL